MKRKYFFALAAAALCAACTQPASPAATTATATAGKPAATAPDASAGSSGAGRVDGVSGPPLDPISLIGTWSFDRTCASEDGMTLAADGTAGTDQGSGMWAVDADHRLVIVIREQEMGKDADKLAERLVWRITATKTVGDDFAGRLEPVRAGQPARDINAKRCPS